MDNTPNLRLLVVDDDDELRTQLKWALTTDYEVLVAGDRPSAIGVFRAARPAVVLLDLGLPPSPTAPDEGLAALADLLAIDASSKIVIVSGQAEKETALNAIGAGAYDFLAKPIDVQELKFVLKRCFHVAHLEREYSNSLRFQSEGVDGIIGMSPSMQNCIMVVRRVATSDAPVLILGESGTGKEMTARAIHRRSSRNNGPFVALNCSAIPESLIESELFGHEKGTFTGAHAQRKGRIEHAAGGTLFLDEIGEISPAIQVKLLRFLQERCIERVGGREEISVDTRIIAATNADLQKNMTAGTFREDLFYRLAVVQVTIPPLRDRDKDVILLARAFLQQFGKEHGRNNLRFSNEALRALCQYNWPGNVRELQNRVRRAVIMCKWVKITAHDLELPLPVVEEEQESLRQGRERVERELILGTLRRTGGNVTDAAILLDISRPTLYELMNKLGLSHPVHRTSETEAPSETVQN